MLRMKHFPDGWKDDNGDAPETAAGKKAIEVASRDKYAALNPGTTGLPVINVEKQSFFRKETPRLFGIGLRGLGHPGGPCRGLLHDPGPPQPLPSFRSRAILILSTPGTVPAVHAAGTVSQRKNISHWDESSYLASR